MQQAVIIFIVTQLSTREEKDSLEQSFKKMDKNGDGTLSCEEIREGFKDVYGEVSDEEIETILLNADIDQSGSVDYSEFLVAAMNTLSILSKEKLEKAFNAFDKDSSGKISMEELKQVLGRTEEFDPQVEALIKEADVNADGEIDLKEFKELMMKVFWLLLHLPN